MSSLSSQPQGVAGKNVESGWREKVTRESVCGKLAVICCPASEKLPDTH